MPDAGLKAQHMLEQIAAIEARGWTMARDGFWHHPEHTGLADGMLLEDAAEVENRASPDPPTSPVRGTD